MCQLFDKVVILEISCRVERFVWELFFFIKFSFLKFQEFVAKWFQKFGNCSMAGLPKLKLICQMNFLGQKLLPMRKLFLYFNSWLSGMKMWLLEDVFGKVVKKLLYVSQRTISMKKHSIETFILFLPLQLNWKKKFNIRRMIFGNVVEIAFYVCSRTISEKQFFFGEK